MSLLLTVSPAIGAADVGLADRQETHPLPLCQFEIVWGQPDPGYGELSKHADPEPDRPGRYRELNCRVEVIGGQPAPTPGDSAFTVLPPEESPLAPTHQQENEH